MDDDIANELASVYETLAYQCEYLREIALSVEALAKTASGYEELARPFQKFREAAEQGEMSQHIELLLQAIRAKVALFRRGAAPDLGPVN